MQDTEGHCVAEWAGLGGGHDALDAVLAEVLSTAADEVWPLQEAQTHGTAGLDERGGRGLHELTVVAAALLGAAGSDWWAETHRPEAVPSHALFLSFVADAAAELWHARSLVQFRRHHALTTMIRGSLMHQTKLWDFRKTLFYTANFCELNEPSP